MLDKLLSVKRLREDEAEKKWIKAKENLKEKIAERAAKKQEYETYKTWRKKKEKHLYEEIIGQDIARKKLDATREQIGLLRQKQVALQQEWIDLGVVVEEARKAVEVSKDDYTKATKKVLKYEELDSIVQEEQNSENERKQEVESEDLQTRKT